MNPRSYAETAYYIFNRLVLIAFFVPVYLHERAHYTTAKLCGVNAEIMMWDYPDPCTRVYGSCLTGHLTRKQHIAVWLAPLTFAIPALICYFLSGTGSRRT